MHLVFFDGIGWDYDVTTPVEHPLGGSQSALCYLAAEFARRGHRVTVLNGVGQPREVQAVRCLPLSDAVLSEPCEAFIALNGPADLALRLRGHLHPGALVVLWTQHAYDQPAMAALRNPAARAAWDAIVCVSEWQRKTFVERFTVDPTRTWLLRNAISPLFERLLASPAELVQVKPSHPVLAYTSTPFRGLNVLASIFPALRGEFSTAELRVYSSMKVYRQEEQDDPFAPLYQRCRAIPGVRYVGSLSQRQLAQELLGVSLLSYPNTFAETSCIAVMEALAAGAYVVTSDLGALPETTQGLATLVPPGLPGEQSKYAGRFLQSLLAVLRQWQQNPEGFAAARFEQVRQINAACTWSVRAQEWEEAIGRMKTH
jgi:glycosyltransferase involved in cell wall biosynthesis